MRAIFVAAATAYRARVEIEMTDSPQEQEPANEPSRFTMNGDPWVFLAANQISAGIWGFEMPIPGTVEIYESLAVTEHERGEFCSDARSARIAIADTTDLQEFRVQLR